MAKGLAPAALDYGMIGSYGNRWANKALAECDFLLVLGSRLDLRQIGSKPKEALAGKKVWQVDVDQGELRKAGPLTLGIHADLRDFCRAVIESPDPVLHDHALDPWHRQIQQWRAAWPAVSELQVPKDTIHPLRFLEELSAKLPPNTAAVVTDVGSHQMWAAQAMQLGEARWLTSGGHGAMGFGLPAAIGAALAAPGQPVVLVTGDASLMVNVQELATWRS